MRAILKGFLLALFVCVLPVACGPEEPGSGGEPGPKVRLLWAETQRIQSPDVTEEQVAERETGEILFLGRVTDPKRRGPW